MGDAHDQGRSTTSSFFQQQCPLPLSLQDLCLVVVINDLDSYPVELLASLPHWLRYHLLNNLPVLDLCRLDHTPIARGINVDEIWTSLRIPGRFRKETTFYTWINSCDLSILPKECSKEVADLLRESGVHWLARTPTESSLLYCTILM